MNCSLVIRAYNEEKHLGRLLEGVRKQSIRDVEVVVVDSGSTDDTVTIATRHGAKLVHISPDEFTFGRSLNLGLTATTRAVVVIASAHVYPVYPDWLEKLVEPFSDPSLALVYGKQRGDDHSRFSEQQIFNKWYPDQSSSHQTKPFCNNANAAIRRSIWKKFPYDETLTGLEDLAWAKQVMSAGYAINYEAEAEVFHIHDETPRGVRNRYLREAMAFKRIYPEAHFSLYDYLRNVVSSTGFDLLHAIREKKFWSSLGSIFWFRTNQFWGTYLGYRSSGVLTDDLRQTFYYHIGWEKQKPQKRNVEPIRYNE
jgi:rhamnosyltransferase